MLCFLLLIVSLGPQARLAKSHTFVQPSYRAGLQRSCMFLHNCAVTCVPFRLLRNYSATVVVIQLSVAFMRQGQNSLYKRVMWGWHRIPIRGLLATMLYIKSFDHGSYQSRAVWVMSATTNQVQPTPLRRTSKYGLVSSSADL